MQILRFRRTVHHDDPEQRFNLMGIPAGCVFRVTGATLDAVDPSGTIPQHPTDGIVSPVYLGYMVTSRVGDNSQAHVPMFEFRDNRDETIPGPISLQGVAVDEGFVPAGAWLVLQIGTKNIKNEPFDVVLNVAVELD